MLLNYFTIAFRLLTRNKLIGSINIIGLSLALSGALLISVFIKDELSYDRFNKNADHIYRVTRNYVTPEGNQHMHLGHLATPFAPLLKNGFSDIIEVTRLGGLLAIINKNVDGSGEAFEVEKVFFAEPSVFKVFSIEVLSGNSSQSLENPLTIMFSDEAAKKYFGTTDIVGKQIMFFKDIAEITGIYKAMPNQSHWHPNALVSFSTLNDDVYYGKENVEGAFENNGFLTYILVKDNFDATKTEQQFPAFLDKHMPSTGNGRKQSESTHLFLQPLASIHLYSHLDSEEETNGNINHVYAMGSIAVFLVIIACFNFINLSTARATQRGKEVGLRKVSGAMRIQLIFQYISESTVMSFLSMMVAFAISAACLHWLNTFTGKTIQLVDYLNINTAGTLIAFVVMLGIAAGLYPAFVISNYKPVQVLKGQVITSRDGIGIRKILVVTQFSISIFMIIATLVTYQQLEFLNKKDLGYNKNQIVAFSFPDQLQFDGFYNTLAQNPAIVNISRSGRIPTSRLLESNNTSTIQNDTAAQKTSVVLKNVTVDQNFFATYNIAFASGKNFPKPVRSQDTFESKVANGFVLNEAACKLLGWTNDQAVGKEIDVNGVKSTVNGVVKDFHFESLQEKIAPIVFINYARFRIVSVNIAASNMEAAIVEIQKAWKQFVPDEPLKYEFVDERYKQLYESEANQQELFMIFAGLAIFIASLGLFGLATFNTLQRSKEVSIRKILGASVGTVVRLLSQEIILLVLVANVVAWPIAWYFMNGWLERFAYHVSISPVTFFVAGILTVIITIVTISAQTVKTALANPAEILKNE
ncbi:MAG: ABC transporter permease [Chryseolinea sp.]